MNLQGCKGCFWGQTTAKLSLEFQPQVASACLCPRSRWNRANILFKAWDPETQKLLGVRFFQVKRHKSNIVDWKITKFVPLLLCKNMISSKMGGFSNQPSGIRGEYLYIYIYIYTHTLGILTLKSPKSMKYSWSKSFHEMYALHYVYLNIYKYI